MKCNSDGTIEIAARYDYNAWGKTNVLCYEALTEKPNDFSHAGYINPINGRYYDSNIYGYINEDLPERLL